MRDHLISIFKLLWEECPTEIKEIILRDEEGYLKFLITLELDWGRDTDTIAVILKDLNAQQKSNIVLSDYTITQCHELICCDEWHSIDSFINCTFFSDEDIRQMKQKLMQRFGRELAASFLRKGEVHKLDRFLKWAFQSKEEVASLRQSINYAITDGNKMDLTEL